MERIYVVAKIQADTGKEVWYAHPAGFPSIPIFGSIGAKQHAQKCAAEKMGLSLKEYMSLRDIKNACKRKW